PREVGRSVVEGERERVLGDLEVEVALLLRLVLELLRDAAQDLERRLLRHALDGHDLEELPEGRVALEAAAEGLGRRLAEDRDLAALEVGRDHAREAPLRVGRA